MSGRRLPMLLPMPAPGPVERARTELAEHLAATPEAAATVRAVLRALDTVRDTIRGRKPDGPCPEALGCSRGATIIAEAAVAAWPDFRERP